MKRKKSSPESIFSCLKVAPILLLFAVLLSAGNVRGAADKSDFNKDGTVDLEDLKIFSLNIAGYYWQSIDWCQWIEDNPGDRNRYAALYDFIRSYFNCTSPPPPPPPPPPEDPLELRNQLTYPTSLTWDQTGKLYVTDAKVGSVFIYGIDLQLTGELKGLYKPLGILVDEAGLIYVGNNGRDNVEIYSPEGEKLATWGEGILAMPNSLARDREGNLYVADSTNNRVSVFDASGNLIGHIGEAELDFPAAVAVHYRMDSATGLEIGELYVADQKSYRVMVYDLQGALLRSFGGQGTTGGMLGNKFYWEGKFVRITGLAFDPAGNLHALDSYYGNAQILNPLTGDYINFYGSPGSGAGQLNVPADLAIDAMGRIVVANTLNSRLELFLQ